MAVRYEWRGRFSNNAVNALHAAGFGTQLQAIDWAARVQAHSLGWVCAFAEERLTGFVNVPWDGGQHAFLVDTVVAPDLHGTGIGSELVAVAVAAARDAGCEWLHVDFVPDLAAFYLEACGFRPTAAGLVKL